VPLDSTELLPEIGRDAEGQMSPAYSPVSGVPDGSRFSRLCRSSFRRSAIRAASVSSGIASAAPAGAVTRPADQRRRLFAQSGWTRSEMVRVLDTSDMLAGA